jgi:hypothetical protein
MAASSAKAMPNGSAQMRSPQRPAYVFTPGLRHTLRPAVSPTADPAPEPFVLLMIDH